VRRFSLIFLIPLLLITGSCAEASAPGFAPHRAIYDMKMTTIRSGSTIAGVEGKMLFEWADACDAWTIDQKLQLKFYYPEGEEIDRVSSFSTWEAKDGKSYRFATRGLANGQETINLLGTATLNESGSIATFTTPADKAAIPLPVGTMFPSAHTLEALDHATKGEKFYARTLFDGSDEEGLVSVSVFISTPIANAAADITDKKLRKNPLLKGQAWPIRMAFFPAASGTGEPDYEMDMQLLPNGVAKSMVIDYGDFVLSGTLSQLESLPRSGC
jgi:hypothetical protein